MMCCSIYATCSKPCAHPASRTVPTCRKQHFNYIAIGIEPTGDFLHRIRRVTTAAELFTVCEEYRSRTPHATGAFDLDLKPRDVLAGEHR